MSIKRLSFPIFIIIVIFLGIFLVKPAVISVMEKRQAKLEKEAELSAVEATKQNLEALESSRESLLGTDEGKMVYAYLPVSLDQDRIVDVFNYYAMQSGAVVNNIAFESKDTRKSPYFPADTQKEMDPLSAPKAPDPSTFTLSANIQGSYESIKTFLKEVSRPARSYRLVSFAIAKKDSGTDPAGQPMPDSGILSGSFSAEFYYLPEKQYPRGYLLPIFSAGQFDMTGIRELMTKEKTVPMLSDPGNAGRVNPFVL
jgi:Tfp pilus assembly protein PilO